MSDPFDGADLAEAQNLTEEAIGNLTAAYDYVDGLAARSKYRKVRAAIEMAQHELGQALDAINAALLEGQGDD